MKVIIISTFQLQNVVNYTVHSNLCSVFTGVRNKLVNTHIGSAIKSWHFRFEAGGHNWSMLDVRAFILSRAWSFYLNFI